MPILLLFVIFAFVLSCNPAIEESVSIHHNHELSESEPVLDGPGMSLRKQMQVFSLFWKDDMFQTGTGLGLTISKLYTEKMGGQVGLSSREGLGSRLSSTFKAWIHE